MEESTNGLLSRTAADRPEYQGHLIFAELDKAIDFYDSLDFSVMGFATQGTRSIINVDSLVYSSIKGTLESVKIILQKGHIGDAFCLLRKYYDLCILNLYTNVYLDEQYSNKKILVDGIVNWMNGKEKLPHNTFRAMRNYLASSSKAKKIIDLVFQNKNYSDTRDRCNDHTHLNYYGNVLINDVNLHFLDRIKSLNCLHSDLMNIIIFHTSCLFYINDHYMMASDYMDHLGMGMSPPEGSQYWVADFIQNIFDNIIMARRPDLGELIKQNTQMQLRG